MIKKIIKKIVARIWTYYAIRKPKNVIDNNEKMGTIIAKNRDTLRKKSIWINDDTISKSVFNYGIPSRVIPLLNKDIGSEITNTDLLVYLSGELKQKISYLEMGVSAGKNFLQISKSLQNSLLTGFDIEVINPNLEEHFKKVSFIEWPSLPKSIKKTNSSLSGYT
jgi:hypothetical protein